MVLNYSRYSVNNATFSLKNHCILLVILTKERSLKVPVLTVTRDDPSTVGMTIQALVNQGVAFFLAILTKERSLKAPVLVVTRGDPSAVGMTMQMLINQSIASFSCHLDKEKIT